jgi:F-type H+-transporting ATPase subunit gamma
MPNLKELKNRITSVTSTQKITKAMQMVAASKLRRAQEAVAAARPYAERMESVLANLAAGMAGNPGAPKLFQGTGKEEVHLLVVATADRGLCGGFNASISRLARQHADRLRNEGKQVKILCIGRKGADALKRQYAASIIDMISLAGVKTVQFSDAQPIAGRILEMFDAGEFDVCTLFYSEFVNVVTQVPTTQQLIPAKVDDTKGTDIDLKGAIYEYEPDEDDILRDLLPRNVSVQLYRALLENVAGEQGAKMSAMDNATRNAGEMIDSLTLQYNRSRQAIITRELIEIISGAEAI